MLRDGSDAFFLIDGGPPDAGDTVADFAMQNAGGHLHAIIATHLDMDHIGGLATVVERCRVDNFYMNLPDDTHKLLQNLRLQRLIGNKTAKLWERVEKNLDTALDVVEALTAKYMAPQRLLAGEYFPVGHGDILLNVLNPTPLRLLEAWAEIEDEESPAKAAGRQFSEVIADIGGWEEDEGLIAQLHPSTAYIPVGTNNYGHPSNEILELLRKYGAATFCSKRVNHCRQACPPTGPRNLCYRHDKSPRFGWDFVTSCTN